jgi:DNA-binding NarL/FixJ family response regulator
MTGDQMLAELRKQPWGKDMKVIILTNMGEQEIPAEVKELGVSAVILKADMTPRQVAELVKKQLGG